MIVYLASPYSSPDGNVRNQRFEAACRVAAEMIRAGHSVLSPIAHSVPICSHGNLPEDWAFWESVDRDLLSKCDRMVVLALSGWHESRGVRAEIEIARELSLPISLAWETSWVDPVRAWEDAERLTLLTGRRPAEETPGLCRA